MPSVVTSPSQRGEAARLGGVRPGGRQSAQLDGVPHPVGGDGGGRAPLDASRHLLARRRHVVGGQLQLLRLKQLTVVGHDVAAQAGVRLQRRRQHCQHGTQRRWRQTSDKVTPSLARIRTVVRGPVDLVSLGWCCFAVRCRAFTR